MTLWWRHKKIDCAYMVDMDIVEQDQIQHHKTLNI